MSQAGQIDFEKANPQIPTSFTPDDGPTAVPILNNIEILGNTAANAAFTKPVWTTASGKTITINTQVGVARTGAPADSNDAGLVSFDDSHFSVAGNGYTTIQVGTAIVGPPSDNADAGVVSFDTADFAVDPKGFVTSKNVTTPISNTRDFSIFYEDFAGYEVSTGQFKYTWKVQGGSVDPIQESGHFGILDLYKNGTGNYYVMPFGASSNTSYVYLGNAKITMSWYFKIPVLSNDTNTFGASMGFFDDNLIGGSSDGIFWRYDHNVNSGKWVINCQNSDVITSTSTDTIVDTDWHELTLIVNSALTSASFFYDGTEMTGSPITTNLPDSSTLQVPFFGFIKSVSTTTTNMYLDTSYIEWDRS